MKYKLYLCFNHTIDNAVGSIVTFTAKSDIGARAKAASLFNSEIHRLSVLIRIEPNEKETIVSHTTYETIK